MILNYYYHFFKGIFSILDQNVGHGDFVYIYMNEIKRMEGFKLMVMQSCLTPT